MNTVGDSVREFAVRDLYGTRPKSIEIGSYFEVKLVSVVRDVEARVERFAKSKQKLVTRDDILCGEGLPARCPSQPENRNGRRSSRYRGGD